MNLAQLAADLTLEEGYRSLLYDDRTGKTVTQGSTIVGQPTIAIGWNVAQRPCPPDLAQTILAYFINQTWTELIIAAPWVLNLPEPCQRAMCDLAYELGVHGILGFTQFIGFMKSGSFGEAADDLATTLWFKQVGTRGPKIQALIRTGVTVPANQV